MIIRLFLIGAFLMHGSVAQVAERVQGQKNIHINTIGLALPGSPSDFVISLLGKPSYRGHQTLVYFEEDKNNGNQRTIVIFHLDEKGRIRYGEAISHEGKIILSSREVKKSEK